MDTFFRQIQYDNKEILSFFKKSRLFGGFKEDLLKKLIPLVTFCEYPDGTTILREGEQNQRIYFLVKGSVDISIKQETIITLRRIGDIFGEMSFIDNKPSMVAAKAAGERTEAFSIEVSNIGTYSDMAPLEIQNFMYRIFAKVLTEKLNLTTHKARQFEETNRALHQTKLSLHEDIAQRQKVELALREANHKTEVANQAKDRFLANISHELRTPMHHILNFSQFGIKKNRTASRDKFLHYFIQIRKTGEKLMTLLNNLLDLSKLEAGSMVCEMGEYSIKGVIEESIKELEKAANDKEISMKLTVPNFDTMVPCDVSKIRQMVLNLLSNAIRFTKNGDTVVVSFDIDEIRLQRARIPALKVQVQDQGVGVPENECKLIFEKFIQSSTTCECSGGAGLGLSLCSEIIKAHNGRIWVDNNKEGGATFSFLLPYQSLAPN